MIRVLEFAVAFILLFVFAKFARQTFRRTTPDDRISEEDMLAGASPNEAKKSATKSTKFD